MKETNRFRSRLFQLLSVLLLLDPTFNDTLHDTFSDSDPSPLLLALIFLIKHSGEELRCNFVELCSSFLLLEELWVHREVSTRTSSCLSQQEYCEMQKEGVESSKGRKNRTHELVTKVRHLCVNELFEVEVRSRRLSRRQVRSADTSESDNSIREEICETPCYHSSPEYLRDVSSYSYDELLVSTHQSCPRTITLPLQPNSLSKLFIS